MYNRFMVYIYGLYDKNGLLRYIGQSVRPKTRLEEHWYWRKDDVNTHLRHWMRSLNSPPEMRILAIVEECEADDTEGNAILAAWKVYGRQQITNTIAGGFRMQHLSPEFQERRLAGLRSPESVAKISKAAKELWKTPERLAIQAEMLAKRNADPAFKTRQAAGASAGMRRTMARMWADPEYRAMVSERSRKQHEDPEFHARHSAAVSAWSKKKWEDPEYRATQSAYGKAHWDDPEYRAMIMVAREFGSLKRPCRGCGIAPLSFDLGCEACLKRRQHPEVILMKETASAAS